MRRKTMYDDFDDIPNYKAESDANIAARDDHGLEAGDVISGGFGGDQTVIEVTEVGVRFDDGVCAPHLTVAANFSMADVTVND